MRFIYTLLSALAVSSVFAKDHVVYTPECRNERTEKKIRQCHFNTVDYANSTKGVAAFRKNFVSTLCRNYYDNVNYKKVLPKCYDSFSASERITEWNNNYFSYGESLILFTTYKNGGTTYECPMASVIRKSGSNDDLIKAAKKTMSYSKYNSCINPSINAMKYIIYGFENLFVYNENAAKKFNEVYKILTKSNKKPALAVSKDDRCGWDHNMTKCPNSTCCSSYGYCGTSKAHCSTSCQSAFGKCK